jgi:hypothetical protein
MAKSKSLLGQLQKTAAEKQEKLQQAAEAQKPNDLSATFSDDVGDLVYHGDKIKTVDELLAHAKVDLDVWEVAEYKINRWEVAGKRKVAIGTKSIETLWQVPNLQITVKLRRKAPKTIQEGILGLIAKFPQAPKPKPRKARPASHLVEFSLYDCHFGKLCWGKQTGSDDYDLQIATEDYTQAVDHMAEHVSHYAVDEVVIPLGNDFLHFDDFSTKATTKGTIVDSTDDRPTKVFRAGYGVLKHAADVALQIANKVHFVWVPGNHDYHASWYLAELLSIYFAKDSRVVVDNAETRKHRLYGKNLIGWDHGEGMSLEKLAHTMPIEAAEYWSQSVYRYMRVGHFHKKKQIRHLNTDTYEGIRVDVIPSLSSTDKWHYKNGYIGSQRAAEVAVWDKEAGMIASFTVEAQSAIENRKKQHDSRHKG